MRKRHRRTWLRYRQRTFEVDDGDHRIEARVARPGQYQLYDADDKQVALRVADEPDSTVTFTAPRPGTYTLYRMVRFDPR